ncbi:VTC domain-containing protein [Vagococcus sp. BWB3-3]|uniref:VTC domain-containing protein n=1 Tax=Vagococcus allomyrinae TaxID=2794353 RepID=A0A940PAD3_9ENTE|nr:VTC domain-containing protein [Vagococcus allomyrinae]MBP1039786.1 VTC domain-containing protein [Vagococcus allomyrinae]
MATEVSKHPKVITKYRLNYAQYSQLRKMSYPHLVEEQAGTHELSALYFDTADFELMREVQEGSIYQELFRMRTSDRLMEKSLVAMEIVKQFDGKNSQRNVLIPYVNAQSFLRDYRKHVMKKGLEAQISREIEYLVSGKNLVPKVVISSDRIMAKCLKKGRLDINFDFNIRWRSTDFDLRKGNIGDFVDPTLNVLMTVKSDGDCPLWFRELLEELSICETSFSSLIVTYKEHLFNKEKKHYVSEFVSR